MKNKYFLIFILLNIFISCSILLCLDSFVQITFLFINLIIFNVFVYIKIFKKNSFYNINLDKKEEIFIKTIKQKNRVLIKNMILFILSIIIVLLINIFTTLNSFMFEAANFSYYLFLFLNLYLLLFDYIKFFNFNTNEDQIIKYLLDSIYLTNKIDLNKALSSLLNTLQKETSKIFKEILKQINKKQSYLLFAQNQDNEYIEKICILMDDYRNNQIKKDEMIISCQQIQQQYEQSKEKTTSDLINKSSKLSNFSFISLDIFTLFILIDFIVKIGEMING